MDQWYTAEFVTMATVFVEIHFQNNTASPISCSFIFALISRLKIWSVVSALSAKTFEIGFMMADSALTRLVVKVLEATSTIIMDFCCTSLMQINRSDSIVTVVNEIAEGFTPSCVIWNNSVN